MFCASRAFEFFDYFRVPYTSERRSASSKHDANPPFEYVALRSDQSRRLFWLPEDSSDPAIATKAGPVVVGGKTTIYARVADNSFVERHLTRSSGNWSPAVPLTSDRGEQIGSIWHETASGSVLLPFDPNESMTLLWSEKYQQFEEMRAFALAKELSRRAYYRARPLLPRRAQLLLRRGFSRVQGRARFPRWPTEPALHDLYGLLFRLLEQVAGEVVPYIAPWPGGHSWALILTHDVEKAMGYERTPSLARLESERGYRSAFFFVPMRDYTVDDDLVTKLDEEGFEVGVHGLFHDGKDVESLVTLQQRLPLVRQAAERWRAKGFRSPGTLRRWDLVPVLGFDYDSSYSDTAPYEPQPGGSCSWLPYFNSDVVELPITLVQDHTIFELLGRDDESLWLDKATFLRERGGMALLLAHPDYLAPGPRLDAYVRFLDHFLDDTSAWKALPRDVSTWWRSRAASSLRREGGTWKIDGPAASEGVVVLADPVDRPEIEAAAMTRGAW